MVHFQIWLVIAPLQEMGLFFAVFAYTNGSLKRFGNHGRVAIKNSVVTDIFVGGVASALVRMAGLNFLNIRKIP